MASCVAVCFVEWMDMAHVSPARIPKVPGFATLGERVDRKNVTTTSE